MQDNTILVRTYTTSVSTLSPIQEQDEQLRGQAVSPEIPLEEDDIVSDEMFYKTSDVDSHVTFPDAKLKECDVEQAPAQLTPTRKKSLLRIILLGATLVPLWAGWSTFVYFLILATLWPYPRTPLTDSNTATTLALICGLALPIITALLFLWAFSPSGIVNAFKTRRKNRGNCATLWPYVLLFIGATLATLVPVAASYAALSHGAECTGSTPVTTYLNAGRGGAGTAVLFDGSEIFDSYTLSPAGNSIYELSNGTSPQTYTAATMGLTPIDDDEGSAMIKIASRAPVAGCRTIKVCTVDPRERGEQAVDLIAAALWAQMNYATKHC